MNFDDEDRDAEKGGTVAPQNAWTAQTTLEAVVSAAEASLQREATTAPMQLDAKWKGDKVWIKLPPSKLGGNQVEVSYNSSRYTVLVTLYMRLRGLMGRASGSSWEAELANLPFDPPFSLKDLWTKRGLLWHDDRVRNQDMMAPKDRALAIKYTQNKKKASTFSLTEDGVVAGRYLFFHKDSIADIANVGGRGGGTRDERAREGAGAGAEATEARGGGARGTQDAMSRWPGATGSHSDGRGAGASAGSGVKRQRRDELMSPPPPLGTGEWAGAASGAGAGAGGRGIAQWVRRWNVPAPVLRAMEDFKLSWKITEEEDDEDF